METIYSTRGWCFPKGLEQPVAVIFYMLSGVAHHFNSLAPKRSRCNSKIGIFDLVLLIGVFRSSHDSTLQSMPHDLTDDRSTLVQVMAWCRQATSHYLSQCCLMASLGHNELRVRDWVFFVTEYPKLQFTSIHGGVRCLTTKSVEVSKLCDGMLKSLYHSEIWQVPWQLCCWGFCQILGQSNNSKSTNCCFEFLWDLDVRLSEWRPCSKVNVFGQIIILGL